MRKRIIKNERKIKINFLKKSYILTPKMFLFSNKLKLED